MLGPLVSANLAVAAAQPVVRPRAYTVLQDQPQTSGTCLPASVARGADIVAVGTYEGGLPLTTLATHEGHRVKAVSISSAENGRPLVVVLTAYDPVVWDLRRVSRRRLRAVLVNGYHAQAVLGAGRATLRINSYNQRNTACGDPLYAYRGGSRLEELDSALRRMLGRGITRFAGNYALKSVAVDGRAWPAGGAIPLAGAVGASAYAIGASVDGPFGMRRLQAQGAIRRATLADVQQLTRLLTRKSPTGRLAPIRPDIYLSETYVLLRPIQVPTGMYGAHSATFLIPRGLPFPKDPGSHNTYWSLATGECRGVDCRLDD